MTIVNINGADRVSSLFEGNPMKPCGLCKNQECTCQTVKRNTPNISGYLPIVKEEKRQRALKRLQKLFKDEEQPLCQFV